MSMDSCKQCGECCASISTMLFGKPCEHLVQEGSVTSCNIHDSDSRPEYCKGYICDWASKTEEGRLRG